MDFSIAALVLASAVLHPLRELLAKSHEYRESAYMGIIATWIILATIHALLEQGTLSVPRAVWPMIVFSAIGLILYYTSITICLRQGDLSVYYPVIRSSPLFILAVNFILFGQHYEVLTLLGIAMAVAGAFFIQYRLGSRWFDNPVVFLIALIAVAGHGITTLADARAMRLVSPAQFLFWTYWLVLPIQAAWFGLTRPKGRTWSRHLLGALELTPVRVLLTGAISYLSYVLILIAFQLGGEAAAVTTIRQTSIPISVLLGVLVLREGKLGPRLSWSMVLAAGIAIIVFVK